MSFKVGDIIRVSPDYGSINKLKSDFAGKIGFVSKITYNDTATVILFERNLESIFWSRHLTKLNGD